MTAVELIIDARAREIDGHSIRRVLPYAKRRNIGPFVFFDHVGPSDFAPGHGLDVRQHPHIGLATITWLYEGALDHRDSLGTIITIRPGAVNWMTAGRGIVHSERTPRAERAAGHRLHAIQTWVALPQSHEEQEPAFAHHPAETLPTIRLPGATGVLIAGEAYGQRSPVVFPSGICQLVLESIDGAEIDAPPAAELGLYVVAGSVDIDGATITAGQLAALGPDRPLRVRLAKDTKIMFAGGDALDAPRHIDWNFVSSRKDRIAKAMADWRDSAAAGFDGSWFAAAPGEVSWIPLPGDPQPVPEDTPPG